MSEFNQVLNGITGIFGTLFMWWGYYKRDWFKVAIGIAIMIDSSLYFLGHK